MFQIKAEAIRLLTLVRLHIVVCSEQSGLTFKARMVSRVRNFLYGAPPPQVS
jgi:hypothetical protein